MTAIVDLLDGQSMVSGSYDKKINIYNLKTGKISYNLPTNKSSVTGIVLNSTATKMVSCGLDNSLNVWQIIRTQHAGNVKIFIIKGCGNSIFGKNYPEQCYDLLYCRIYDARGYYLHWDKGWKSQNS